MSLGSLDRMQAVITNRTTKADNWDFSSIRKEKGLGFAVAYILLGWLGYSIPRPLTERSIVHENPVNVSTQPTITTTVSTVAQQTVSPSSLGRQTPPSKRNTIEESTTAKSRASSAHRNLGKKDSIQQKVAALQIMISAYRNQGKRDLRILQKMATELETMISESNLGFVDWRIWLEQAHLINELGLLKQEQSSKQGQASIRQTEKPNLPKPTPAKISRIGKPTTSSRVPKRRIKKPNLPNLTPTAEVSRTEQPKGAPRREPKMDPRLKSIYESYALQAEISKIRTAASPSKGSQCKIRTHLKSSPRKYKTKLPNGPKLAQPGDNQMQAPKNGSRASMIMNIE